MMFFTFLSEIYGLMCNCDPKDLKCIENCKKNNTNQNNNNLLAQSIINSKNPENSRNSLDHKDTAQVNENDTQLKSSKLIDEQKNDKNIKTLHILANQNANSDKSVQNQIKTEKNIQSSQAREPLKILNDSSKLKKSDNNNQKQTTIIPSSLDNIKKIQSDTNYIPQGNTLEMNQDMEGSTKKMNVQNVLENSKISSIKPVMQESDIISIAPQNAISEIDENQDISPDIAVISDLNANQIQTSTAEKSFLPIESPKRPEFIVIPESYFQKASISSTQSNKKTEMNQILSQIVSLIQESQHNPNIDGFINESPQIFDGIDTEHEYLRNSDFYKKLCNQKNFNQNFCITNNNTNLRPKPAYLNMNDRNLHSNPCFFLELLDEYTKGINFLSPDLKKQISKIKNKFVQRYSDELKRCGGETESSNERTKYITKTKGFLDGITDIFRPDSVNRQNEKDTANLIYDSFNDDANKLMDSGNNDDDIITITKSITLDPDDTKQINRNKTVTKTVTLEPEQNQKVFGNYNMTPLKSTINEEDISRSKSFSFQPQLTETITSTITTTRIVINTSYVNEIPSTQINQNNIQFSAKTFSTSMKNTATSSIITDSVQKSSDSGIDFLSILKQLEEPEVKIQSTGENKQMDLIKEIHSFLQELKTKSSNSQSNYNSFSKSTEISSDLRTVTITKTVDKNTISQFSSIEKKQNEQKNTSDLTTVQIEKSIDKSVILNEIKAEQEELKKKINEMLENNNKSLLNYQIEEKNNNAENKKLTIDHINDDKNEYNVGNKEIKLEIVPDMKKNDSAIKYQRNKSDVPKISTISKKELDNRISKSISHETTKQYFQSLVLTHKPRNEEDSNIKIKIEDNSDSNTDNEKVIIKSIED